MGYPAKALFREEMNIKGFCKDHGVGIGQTFFLTMTFSENVLDKKEAVRCWNILRTQITKIFPIFRYICVWERQERGAWHLHALCNCPSVGSMKKFKAFLRNVVFNSATPIGWIQSKWTYGNSKSIGSYMYKYLTKEFREKYVRYINYSRNFLRKCSSQFMFVGGKSDEWRACCRVLDEMFPYTFKFFYSNADFNSLLACVNSVAGDSKSFFNGLRDMVLFFEKIHFLNYQETFFKQVSGYVSDCKSTYTKICVGA